MPSEGVVGRKGVVVSALGVTQTLAWASTYYLTAVFADRFRPTSTCRHLVLRRVSAALLLSGLLGPLAGRTIDRRGGRDVLAATNFVSPPGWRCCRWPTAPSA